MKANIALLPGDGIGPEVVAAACQILNHIAKKHGHTFIYREALIGGCAIDAKGTALPPETEAICLESDAILLGAVGGPKWDDPRARVRPEQGLLGIRKKLGLFANIRPIKALPALLDGSPLRRERVEGVDFVILRELTGGLYFGEPRFTETTTRGERSVDTLEYADFEIRRILKLAIEIARARKRHVTSVDKANVLETSRLWRRFATELASECPDIRIEHQLVDSCAMRLITAAQSFDVIVTENMFGDILSDEASVLTGSLGMLPSASLGETSRGLYEPVHGSAPDIAGQGIANPLAAILSAAMLLRHSLQLEAEAAAIEQAVEDALDLGARTRDMGGPLGTEGMTEAVLAKLA
ncbi:MAG: 3-isopropylmalate dehydrogenase [Deltaproteobacteria bacterium]|nr:3-isopropylmalate dehydrogenase [Deltaproteobacteria bacterium]